MSTPAGSIWKIGDKTVDFDSLEVQARNVGMAALINELPPIVSLAVSYCLLDAYAFS